MDLLILHGDLVFAAVVVVAMIVVSAVITRRVRQAAIADATSIRAAAVRGDERLIAGERVTLRGRLCLESEPRRRHVDRAPVAVTSIVSDPDRHLAGHPERTCVSVRAARLSLEVREAPGDAPLRIALSGPLHVLVGAQEYRASAPLRRLGGLRRRVHDEHPDEGPQMDLDYLVERSLADGDPVAITGLLGREQKDDATAWVLGPREIGAPFRREGDRQDDPGALVVMHEGPPRRVWTDRRRHALAIVLAGLVPLAAAHGLARSFGLKPRRFDPLAVAELTPELTAKVAISSVSPIDRGDALFEFARAVEFQPEADATTFARAMDLYARAGGCRLAVAAAAATHPEAALPRALSCPGGRGEAIALYQLGRFEEAAAALAARSGDPAFLGERAWRIEAMILGRRPGDAAAALRMGTRAPETLAEAIADPRTTQRWLLELDAGSNPDVGAEAQADALDDPEATRRRIARLRGATGSLRRHVSELLAVADAADPDDRFALLDAIEPADLFAEDLALWWLLRVEVRPDAGWKPPTSVIVSPRLRRADLKDGKGDPEDELFTSLQAPPYLSIDPMAHLETVQPLPDLPWGLVFAIARDLEHRALFTDEARVNRARVSHAAGVFELLAGEYAEAERWLAIAARECDSGWYDRREDLAYLCNDLPADLMVAALFARNWEEAELRSRFRWRDANRRSRFDGLLKRVRKSDAPLTILLGIKAIDDDGWRIALDLAEDRRREHPAIRLFGAPTLDRRDALARYLLWSAPPGACIPSIGETLLPETVARAQSLAAIGEEAAAEELRARARRMRERLQERDGAVALWLARKRHRCINNPAKDPRETD